MSSEKNNDLQTLKMSENESDGIIKDKDNSLTWRFEKSKETVFEAFQGLDSARKYLEEHENTLSEMKNEAFELEKKIKARNVLIMDQEKKQRVLESDIAGFEKNAKQQLEKEVIMKDEIFTLLEEKKCFEKELEERKDHFVELLSDNEKLRIKFERMRASHEQIEIENVIVEVKNTILIEEINCKSLETVVEIDKNRELELAVIALQTSMKEQIEEEFYLKDEINILSKNNINLEENNNLIQRRLESEVATLQGNMDTLRKDFNRNKSQHEDNLRNQIKIIKQEAKSENKKISKLKCSLRVKDKQLIKLAEELESITDKFEKEKERSENYNSIKLKTKLEHIKQLYIKEKQAHVSTKEKLNEFEMNARKNFPEIIISHTPTDINAEIKEQQSSSWSSHEEQLMSDTKQRFNEEFHNVMGADTSFDSGISSRKIRIKSGSRTNSTAACDTSWLSSIGSEDEGENDCGCIASQSKSEFKVVMNCTEIDSLEEDYIDHIVRNEVEIMYIDN